MGRRSRPRRIARGKTVLFCSVWYRGRQLGLPAFQNQWLEREQVGVTTTPWMSRKLIRYVAFVFTFLLTSSANGRRSFRTLGTVPHLRTRALVRLAPLWRFKS